MGVDGLDVLVKFVGVQRLPKLHFDVVMETGFGESQVNKFNQLKKDEYQRRDNSFVLFIFFLKTLTFFKSSNRFFNEVFGIWVKDMKVRKQIC